MTKAVTQPKNFGFGEDENALKDLALKFFQENFSASNLHDLVAADSSSDRSRDARWDRAMWQQVVDLGWLMTAVPERAGGLGMSATAVAGLVEEVGRAAFPCPLIPTLGVTYILDACRNQQADDVLARVAEGESFSYASCNQYGSLSHCESELKVEHGKLNGSVYFVQDAQKVDGFLINAKVDGEVALYALPATAKGLSINPDAIVDLTRDQATLACNDVDIAACEFLVSGDDAIAALDTAEPALLVLLSADMCGAAEWQLQTTSEYARTRQQFDRTIGFFQAVKHPLVEFMVEIDQARSLLYNAACAIDYEPEMAAQCARMAKAAANDAVGFGSRKSVQLHGGIGFTWECYVHLYLKRQLHSQVLLGDATYQRARLAELVLAG
ncbi:MAG: alkylation response protein AidB-like acyl-CoA dehydrogenase [Granulosicoccus sp.]|jgi:alkylation response protein AidB-like acyl-CoA dehydrogenase